MTKGDEVMNQRILRAVHPELYSKESLAKSYFKNSGLEGIVGAEKTEIRNALLDNWADKGGFVEAMDGQYDRSAAEWGNLFDNERHISDGAGSQVRAGMQGATTKTWATHPESSTAGPCDDCESMDGETVAIDEAYSNGDQIPGQNHPGCCCGEDYV